MRFQPEFNKVREIAAQGKYDILPVSCEILSDICTPIEAIAALKNISTHCYMLESVAEKEKWGRYTFLGFEPKTQITACGSDITIGGLTMKTENPSIQIRQILSKWRSPKFDYLPSFTGGLVGYFSYDFLAYTEKKLRIETEDTENFKDVDLMLFDKVIAFDNFRQKIILIANMSLEDPETGYNKAKLELQQMADILRSGTRKKEPAGHLTTEVTPLFNKEQYCEMVEKAKHHIHEGDIF
ncbi:MAG: anthranilate synthase component I, partial [Lachnospiraceae bacterium]|nr:anthranilate synthase component I [Lachnospiraceae bacterium]